MFGNSKVEGFSCHGRIWKFFAGNQKSPRAHLHLDRRTALKILYWNFACAATLVALGFSLHLRRIHRYDSLVVKVARENGLDPRLVAAVIWTESRFDPTRVGRAGEIGLMQVTETAAREWATASGLTNFSENDLFEPETNLRAGCWYLARALRNWARSKDDPLPYALAEYNAGPGNARRWEDSARTNGKPFLESVTYPGTRRYVRDIIRRYH